MVDLHMQLNLVLCQLKWRFHNARIADQYGNLSFIASTNSFKVKLISTHQMSSSFSLSAQC